MKTFEHIPHMERKIYKRTFMNEIALYFTYEQVNLKEVGEGICQCGKALGIEVVPNDRGNEDILSLKDGNAIITFTSSGVLVSLPSREYQDFEKTGFIWEHLEALLTESKAVPLSWSFTKGNRWVFNKPIAPKMTDHVYKVVLSKELLENTVDKHFYIESSIDNSHVFTCRYGLEKINGKDSVGLKTMIVSLSYSLNNLKEQIFDVNELMFDVWSWSVSEDVKQLMQKEK